MDNTFKSFLFKNKKEYIFPVGLPILVFVGSCFWTNIGWYAVPACFFVTAIMVGLTTFMLYNRWWFIENTIASIKKSGTIRKGVHND